MNKITDVQLDVLIKSAVNSYGPLPPDEKFAQIISALRELRKLRAAMLQGAAGNSPAIPDGYALVPVEPTKEMIEAGWSYYMTSKAPGSSGVYSAMLAAAPQQEAE